jgi:hypothetical protein
MNKLEQAKWIFERNLQWIAAAEVKIGFIITLDIAMLAALAGLYSTAKSHPLTLTLLVIVTSSLLFLSLLAAVSSFIPRLNGPDNSLIFFGKIAAINEHAFHKRYQAISEEEFLDDLLQQIYRNAQIASEKHRNVRQSLLAAVLAAPIWISSIILGSVLS